MSAPKVAYIVSHTHWDREWYLTFHEFRTRLTRVVRQVLDALEHDPEFEHFLLDGQAILLEDHVAVHPEDAPRIRALAEQGRLSLGPWYILPDEFLVSAEATVRNLLIGQKVAGGFGGVQRVGYMPDSFGHIAQMPQILRRAGIDSFVYTRGNGDEIEELGHEYLWQAPDGSEVLAINQCGGYCNASGLGFQEIWHAHTRRNVDPDRAVEQVRELFDKMARLSRGDVYLLNNGCDHFPPQQEFGRVLAALREAFPDTEFLHADLARYVDAVRAAGFATRRYTGELAGGKLHHILSGVWSARMPLKQRNDRCQTLLADVVEPLCAYTHLQHGGEYPAGAIEYAWKLLMQNHPHDSICGCSIDEVHREMGPRFAGVEQTAEQLVRHELERLAPTFARRADDDRHTVICVANPLPEPRSEVVERMVVLQPFGENVDDLRLFDETGSQVPFHILERRYVERFWGVDYRMELDVGRQREKFGVYLDRFGERILRGEDRKDESDCYLTIQFVAELPALGHARFFLREDPGSPRAKSPDAVRVGEAELENRYCRVRLHPDGSFDLDDKVGGQRYEGLNVLEDTEDVGDEYDYCSADESTTVLASGVPGAVRQLEAGGLRARLEAAFTMNLPRSIAAGRRKRERETVACATRVRLGLTHDSPLIDIEVEFDNRAEDHRLRARFPTSIRTETVVSDGHFMIHHRPVRKPAGDDWVQPPPSTYPQQEFSLVQDGRRGLALLNLGLPEIEAAETEDGVRLDLTLLRAVGWLSRDDFASRRHSNAGPTLSTPDAQCPGRHRARYALVPFAGDFIEAGIKSIGRRYRVPPVCVQGVEDRGVPGGAGLFAKDDPRVCVSAVKLSEDRSSLILRLYNLTDQPVEERLRFGADRRFAYRTDLLERRESELQLRDSRELRIPLEPHEIVTLEIG